MEKKARSVSVVTGAAGFVGQALVRRLLAEGDVVRAVALPGDPRLSELSGLGAGMPLEVSEADVCDAAALSNVMHGARRVFHTAAVVHAWVPRERYRAVNVGGTQNVARAAHVAGVERFVAVSTSDVFGVPRGAEILDERSPFRRWNEPYADSKIEAEEWLWAFRRESGLPLTVIYPGWVYGPGDRAFFPSLAEAVAAGQLVFWCRDVVLAWVYIDNLVDACLLASTAPQALGEGYLIHDGATAPTLEDLGARLAAALGAKRPTVHVPYAVAYGVASALQTSWRVVPLRGAPPLTTADVKAFGRPFRLSNEKALSHLGWKPRVSVEEGMARAMADVARERPKSS